MRPRHAGAARPGSTRAKRGLALFGTATGGIAGPDCFLINRFLAIADVLQ